ncbi:MAG: Fic family protein [Candidatus Micrarchaeota archaeon]|nr:Fic family protein [Candidatus Micrarchaeota archaeon]
MLIDKSLYGRILRKKTELDSLRPFNKGALENLRESFRVEMTYNSNAIEGNTLTLGETKMVLEEGITVGGKSMREYLEATNHGKAMDFVETLVKKPKIEENDVLNLHALILDRIDPENAGYYRRGLVRISGTDYTPPNAAKVPELMKEVYAMLNSAGDPIETAARIHQKFVDIHPFVDGNGRAARLLLNICLMRKGYPPVVLLKTDRKRYLESIMKAQNKGDYEQFINLVAKAVERSLDIYLDALGKTQSSYLSLSEASKISKNRYSEEYLSLLARTGKIGAVKLGRNWKITKEELEEYENEHA